MSDADHYLTSGWAGHTFKGVGVEIGDLDAVTKDGLYRLIPVGRGDTLGPGTYALVEDGCPGAAIRLEREIPRDELARWADSIHVLSPTDLRGESRE